MASNQISLNPLLIARLLVCVAFLVVLASIAGQLTAYFMSGPDCVYMPLHFFNLDSERNIPTFFSALLLLFAALLLSTITILERKRTASYVLHWAILAFGFLFMAFDELICLHEQLVVPIRKLLGNGNLGFFYFAWVIPGLALVLVLALFFRRFLLQLPSRTRLTFVIAGAAYIGGCIGFESIGGYYAELHGKQTFIYNSLVTVEESLEMAGVIIFIWGLMEYIADNYSKVTFRVGSNQQ